MGQPAEIYVGENAIEPLRRFCDTLPEKRLTLVADRNTYAALGERVERALSAAGFDVLTIILRSDEVVADERHLGEVLVKSRTGPQTFVAVGSGTITDITRYVSFRTGNDFLSVPTAASVDGYLSTGAPIVIDGIKETIKTHGPAAVFADLPTLMAAPRALTAAGFGDVVGKATSLADWILGDLLWDEPFSAEIERRTRIALDTCMSLSDQIGSGSEKGIRSVIDALFETGRCMIDFGDSRPASGSEHHCSHYWEMQLLQMGRPAILHGAKVGYAAILISQLYAKIGQLSREDVARLVEATFVPSRSDTLEEIDEAYGAQAEGVAHIQAPFLDLSAEDMARLRQRILDNWPAIVEIAATVPSPMAIKEGLEKVGGPTHWQTLGLEEDQVEPGLLYGHYLRNRFTVVKLFRMLGLDVRSAIDYA